MTMADKSSNKLLLFHYSYFFQQNDQVRYQESFIKVKEVKPQLYAVLEGWVVYITGTLSEIDIDDRARSKLDSYDF